MKYRKLEKDEIIKVGDIAWCDGSVTPDPGKGIGLLVLDRNTETIDQRADFCGNTYWRPVTHNWVSFKDRMPTKEDGWTGDHDVIPITPGAQVMCIHQCGDISMRSVTYLNTSGVKGLFTHWMPLNFIEEAPKPVEVDGHEVLPQKDGSIRVGCKVVSKEDFDEIIRQRNEAMK